MKRSGGVLAAALAALAYLNALDNPFVYDDYDTVVANPSLADPTNVRFVLVHSPYRAVVNVSYAIDRVLWGTQPFGFHLTNVLLHGLVVVLLFMLLRRACGDARRLAGRGSADARGMDSFIAFAGAALFGVHPLMSEAVGYVSGRSELLCGAFSIACVLSARAAMLGARWMWAWTAAWSFLALMSKEVALALPVVVLAYDWLLLTTPAADRRRRALFVFVPAVLAVAAMAFYRLTTTAGSISIESPVLNMWTQAIVIWRYIGLFLLPVGQAVMHSVHHVRTLYDPLALAAVTGLAVVLATSLAARRGAPLVAFGTVWYLATIAPSSSVVALREGMAEHRAYLASAGLVLAIAGAAVRATAREPRIVPRLAHAAGLAVVCAALGCLTFVRNEVWEDPARLWREAVVHAADMWEPHYALADVLRESGDCSGAVKEYQAVVRMRPHHRDAHTNLGICLARLNRLEEAERAFAAALEIDPSFPRGYTNLAALALVAGDPARARELYQQAIAVDARNVLARMQLARIHETVFGDFHAAARMCGEARALAPFTPGVAECVDRNQRLARAKDEGK